MYVFDSIVHGLRNLLNFRGRDSQAQFWPYAISVTAAGLVAQAVAMQSVYEEIARNIGVGPIKAGAPEANAEVISGATASVFPIFRAATSIGALAYAAMAVLLIAAVTRRLRDRNKWVWSSLPTIILGFVALATSLASLGNFPPSNFGLFFAAFGFNALHVVALIWLIVLTAGDSAPGPKVSNPSAAPAR